MRLSPTMSMLFYSMCDWVCMNRIKHEININVEFNRNFWKKSQIDALKYLHLKQNIILGSISTDCLSFGMRRDGSNYDQSLIFGEFFFFIKKVIRECIPKDVANL